MESAVGLDMPVVLPGWVPADEVRLVGSGIGSGADGGQLWEDVTLQPAGEEEGPPAWQVRTYVRRGRPDDRLIERTASTAVLELFLQQIPHGAGPDDTRRLVHEASDLGDDLAGRLRDDRTWHRTTADVDGSAFLLWLHRRAEGYAAVADLGSCVAGVHGQLPPDEWRFTLLDPATARATLRTG